MSKILYIFGKKILNYNKYLSIRSEVYLEDGSIGIANIPFESNNIYKNILKNKKEHVYIFIFEKKINKYIDYINNIIFPILKGKNINFLLEIDNLILNLYLENKNDHFLKRTILVVSLSIARAFSSCKKISLHKFISSLCIYNKINNFPIPILNLINKENSLCNLKFDIYEFMIQPILKENTSNFINSIYNIYSMFKKILYFIDINLFKKYKKNNIIRFESNELILKIIKFCIEKNNFKLGDDLLININCFASELYDINNNLYIFKNENKIFNSNEFIKYLKNISKKYYIHYIENLLYKYDWKEYFLQTKLLGNNIQLVGNDVFNNDKFIFNKGIENKICNSILIEYYNISTFSEIISIINIAKKNNYKIVISNIFRNIDDLFAIDLAIGIASNQIKIGFFNEFYKYIKLINSKFYI